MGIGVVGPGGRLLWANDPFCGALGRTRAELLGADDGGPITRMTPLAPSGELALAWVIELEDSAEPVSASEHIPAVYAFNWMGNLAAAWRRAADVEDHPLISDLVGRAVAGEPATGLLVVEGTGHEIDLMPAQDPQGRAGSDRRRARHRPAGRERNGGGPARPGDRRGRARPVGASAGQAPDLVRPSAVPTPTIPKPGFGVK